MKKSVLIILAAITVLGIILFIASKHIDESSVLRSWCSSAAKGIFICVAGIIANHLLFDKKKKAGVFHGYTPAALKNELTCICKNANMNTALICYEATMKIAPCYVLRDDKSFIFNFDYDKHHPGPRIIINLE